jgi:transcriptional regulator with XRE-family HTH domain
VRVPDPLDANVPEIPAEVVRDVGRKIAELRRGLGLTQEDLAERLGMPIKNLQRIERGLQNLTIRTLVRMAAAVGVKTAELFVAPASREVKRGRPRKG